MRTREEQPKVSSAWAVVLAAVLLGPPSARVSAAPADAAAAPVEPAALPAALEVRVEPATLDSELDRVRVEQRGRAVLDRRAVGLEPGERIVVDLAGEAGGYRVIVRAFRHGVPVAHEPASFEHDGTIDELLDRAAVAIDDAADRLIAERERVALAARPPAPMTRKQAQDDAEGGERPVAEPTPRRRFRLRIPGAVAAGLGASMMAGGTILTARGQQPPGDSLLTPEDLLPPGAALLGAGAAFLATGVTLLVIDAVRCRRHPVASCEDQRPTLRPSP